MRIILSIALAAVIITAVHGWGLLSVVAEAPGQLVNVLERAK